MQKKHVCVFVDTFVSTFILSKILKCIIFLIFVVEKHFRNTAFIEGTLN